ncbi:hypothetical protein PHMEG_00012470 [Phytophthora megakarya]|uniref:RxLR effector protein n=1 Tax=Phytophthora megakarya TaxID=4795 RepID=A0A225W8N8_9STRA|nr:hypothetical protein PHMEG_00012470 [Phytophthora megakarya]
MQFSKTIILLVAGFLIGCNGFSHEREKATSFIRSGEERAGGTTGRSAAARTSVGGAISTNTGSSRESEMITVTTYNGNGLRQRLLKWWKRIFGSDTELRSLDFQQQHTRSDKVIQVRT